MRSGILGSLAAVGLLGLLGACCLRPGPCTVKPAAPVAPIIIDSDDQSGRVERKGDWPLGVGGGDWNDSCLFAFQGKGECKLTWRPDLPRDGKYRVSIWFGGDPNADHATNSPFTVYYDGGRKTHLIDQTKPSNGWLVLGLYPFKAGRSGCVELTNDANGNVVADAVKFEFVE